MASSLVCGRNQDASFRNNSQAFFHNVLDLHFTLPQDSVGESRWSQIGSRFSYRVSKLASGLKPHFSTSAAAAEVDATPPATGSTLVLMEESKNVLNSDPISTVLVLSSKWCSILPSVLNLALKEGQLLEEVPCWHGKTIAASTAPASLFLRFSRILGPHGQPSLTAGVRVAAWSEWSKCGINN